MSTVPFALMWGPDMIGKTVALALYGVGIGQVVFYAQAFPCDRLHLKALVFITFILDSIQTIALLSVSYHLWIECRSNPAPDCTIYLSPTTILGTFLLHCITFIVQSFYAHRVWIISGNNRVITSGVLVPALAQLLFGILVTTELVRSPKYEVLFTTKFLPLAAVTSAVCDTIIMISIMYYLRPRTGVHRRGGYMKKLNVVFVQMGVFTFINALALVILYCIQDSGVTPFLTAAPGVILSKTYMNSMLSVLNARKSIREEQEALALRTIEIPTIPTIR